MKTEIILTNGISSLLCLKGHSWLIYIYIVTIYRKWGSDETVLMNDRNEYKIVCPFTKCISFMAFYQTKTQWMVILRSWGDHALSRYIYIFM